MTFSENNFGKKISVTSKNVAKFSVTLIKNGWFYIVLTNYIKKKKKKNLPKWKIWVGRARKTEFSFFMALALFGHIYILHLPSHRKESNHM